MKALYEDKYGIDYQFYEPAPKLYCRKCGAHGTVWQYEVDCCDCGGYTEDYCCECGDNKQVNEQLKNKCPDLDMLRDYHHQCCWKKLCVYPKPSTVYSKDAIGFLACIYSNWVSK